MNRADRSREGGFTIIESVVALVIIFGVLLVLLRTFDSGIKVLVETKRQAAGSAFASELLERARSLEWENVGLTDQSNDVDCPPALNVDGVACVDWAAEFGIATDGDGDYTFEGDKLVFVNPTSTFDPFLSFHSEEQRDGTMFDRYIFVTQLTDGGGAPTFRKVTAVVQWVPPGGFRREVRAVTYAAPFDPPAQPAMTASVVYTTGSLELLGSVPGTSGWLFAAKERPPLDTGTHVVFPTAELSLSSDYVSDAQALVRGIEADYEWVDGFTLTSADTVQAKAADDDFSSGLPLNDPSTGPLPMPHWQIFNGYASTPLYDLTGAETDDGFFPDFIVFDGEALSQDGGDNLPYASINTLAAGGTGVWFWEYRDDGPRNLRVQYEKKAADAGLAATLTELQYVYLWMHHGFVDVEPALIFKGEIDRFETNPSTRRVDVRNVSLTAEPYYLFYEDAYWFEYTPADYLGFIRITPPALRADVYAGEVTPPSTLTAGKLTIEVWDHATASYVLIYNTDPTTIAVPDPVPPILLNYTIPGTSLHPQTDTTITAILQLNPTIGPNVSTYPGGAVSQVTAQVPPMLTGTLTYTVFDRIWGALLYDLSIDIELGGLSVSANYVVPGA